MITTSNQFTATSTATADVGATAAATAANCSSTDNPTNQSVQLSSFWYILLALITSVGLLVSLVSNMIIIYLFTRTPSLRRNPSNIVAVNLSLSDLLYCLQWPSVIYCSITQSTWLLEINFVCQSFGFITVITASASVLTVLIMSIERAIVIRHSIHVRNRFTIKTSWLVLALIWLVSILTSLPPLFGKYNRFTMDLSKTSCTIDYLSNKSNYKLYIFMIGIIYWIAPAIIITICYVLIIITFKRSSQSLKQVVESSNEGQLEQKRRASVCRLSLERANSSNCFNESGRRKATTTTTTTPRFSSTKRRGYLLRDSIRLQEYVFGSFRRRRQVRPDVEAATTTNELISSVSNQVIEADKQAPIEAQSGQPRRPLLRRAATGIKVRLPIEERRSSGAGVTFSDQMRQSKRARSEQQQISSVGLVEVAQMERAKPIDSHHHQHSVELDGDSSCSSRDKQSSSRFNLNNIPLIGQLKRNFKSTTSINSIANNNNNNSIAISNNNYNPNLSRTFVQIRLAKMSFYLILLWLISWTPIASLAMINSLIKCHQTSAFALFMANTMTKLGPTFDVFIYGISHPKIKSKFKQIIKWMFCMGNVDRKSLFSPNCNTITTNTNKHNPTSQSTNTRSNQQQSQQQQQTGQAQHLGGRFSLRSFVAR